MKQKAVLDKELQEYRDLMEVPSQFDEGFSMSSFWGAVFIALVMIPGAMYMELIAGVGVGSAAQWVTVILFVELAKRANRHLKRAEVFILFYMAGSILAGGSTTLLFRQFFCRSEAAASFGLSGLFPSWVVPENLDELPRTFFTKEWLFPLLLFAFQRLMTKIDTDILGYGLFRMTSDVEKLPFPMAPMQAEGMMTLAESFEESGSGGKKAESWRWRYFSIGVAIGLGFGFVYMGVPAVTGLFLPEPIQIFPIPFVDWTPQTGEFLPAVATGFAFDLGSVILGMVMPFFAMVGSFLGLIITFVLNPGLYDFHILHTWKPGQSTVETLFNNNVDFYFSFGIGLSLAIAVIGILSVIRTRSVKLERKQSAAPDIPPGRGDIPNWLFLSVYVLSCALFITISGFLIGFHKGVMIVMFFFAFLYTPIISYVTARLEGLAGQVVEVPYIREIAFILSGYHGMAVWYVPIPHANYGVQTVFYKTAELTGTKFRSVWKADLFLFPIILLATIGFSSFIFSLAEIPSAVYPYTQEIWEFTAKNAALIYSSTLGGYSPFAEAFRAAYIIAGVLVGLLSFGTFALFSAPTTLCYGIVRGFNQTMPHSVIPEFIGALLGRFYFQKKYGRNWKKYIIVISAGYFVGAGLMSMLCVGFVFLAKASGTLPY